MAASRGTASALQKGILFALETDTKLSEMVEGRIYDHVPPAATFPYIEFGSSDELDDTSDCITAESISLQIDVWSRDDGRLWKCRDIVGAVRRALHLKDLILDDPYAASGVRVVRGRTVGDPDGITAHGIITVIARVEEHPANG